jgi:uncharacterized protein (TIGR04222 family)
MGCLAWLLAMGGIGGASLAFALGAPGQAWWGLGLVVVALLAGPHLLQWWLGRARRTERLAARWWAAAPDPMEVAFVCGGPDRVVDLVVADLVAEDRLTIDEQGRLGLADGIGDEREEAGFRREIHHRLSYGHTDLAALRFSARPATALQRLWRSAARQGLLLPGWRREYTHWYVAGAIVVVGYCVAIALGELQQRELDVDNVTFVVGIGAVGLGVIALWRAKFLVGYEFDPRTAAGLRAAELACADSPDDRRHRVAVRGIRSMRDLRPGSPAGNLPPVSRWHVPWYAKRVREPGSPWWRQEAAQATTDYDAAFGEAGEPADDGHTS